MFSVTNRARQQDKELFGKLNDHLIMWIWAGIILQPHIIGLLELKTMWVLRFLSIIYCVYTGMQSMSSSQQHFIFFSSETNIKLECFYVKFAPMQ